MRRHALTEKESTTGGILVIDLTKKAGDAAPKTSNHDGFASSVVSSSPLHGMTTTSPPH
jgi:hypothetical protein